MRMYNQYLRTEPKVLEYDPALPECIICDIDGTLAKKEIVVITITPRYLEIKLYHILGLLSICSIVASTSFYSPEGKTLVGKTLNNG